MSENMEIEHVFDGTEQLQSRSLEDVASCSSSILNSPAQGEKSDCEGSNVPSDIQPSASNLAESGTRGGNNTAMTEEMKKSLWESRQKNYLTGAGKRWFKRLLDLGYSEDKARDIARNPSARAQAVAATPTTAKRQLEISNSSDNNPQPKRKRGCTRPANSVNRRMEAIRANASGSKSRPEARTNTPHTYSETLKLIRIGILPKNYPKVEFTTTNLELIEQSILGKVIQQRKEQFKPKFANCKFKSGYMVLGCQDKLTADWLKTVVPDLKPWDTADLVVVDEDKIPKPDVLVVLFPKSADNDNDTILGLVESQNDISTDAWRILKRSIVKEHIKMLLSIDDASMRKITEWGMKLNYKFGFIYPKKISSNQWHGNPESVITDDCVEDQNDNHQEEYHNPICEDIGTNANQNTRNIEKRADEKLRPDRKDEPEAGCNRTPKAKVFQTEHKDRQPGLRDRKKPPRHSKNV